MSIQGGIWTPPNSAQNTVSPHVHTRRRRVTHTQLSAVASVTGLLMALFVLVHAMGNLKIFQSAAHFDAYAHWLRHAFEPVLPAGALLWGMRLTMGACLLAHLWATLTLWWRGRRDTKVHGKHWRRWRPAQLMLPSGLVIAVFLGVHLVDLTIMASGSPAGNLTRSLGQPVMFTLYALTLVALALHIAHGVRAAVSALGGTYASAQQWSKHVGRLLSLTILVIDLAAIVGSQL